MWPFKVCWQQLVWLVLLFGVLCIPSVQADVVKPALIEISAHKGGKVEIEIRASIEALLTGINGQYKNTQDAPQAEEYDALRVLSASELGAAFEPFKQRFLTDINLQVDGQAVELNLAKVDIPPPGYPKVPRISLIVLQGQVATQSGQLTWYYPAAFGDNAVRVRQVDEANEKWHWSQWQWLRKDEPSQAFSLTEVFQQPSWVSIMVEYVELGFVHIVPKGLDHILFIVGLFLFSVQLRPLLWQVTMFTIAHTITLGLSMAGVISLSAQIIEPLIALSIAYIGVENLFVRGLHKTRLLLVFGFGLLHGLGFAEMLAELGMPDGAFLTALLSFNIGVEIGQLAVLVLSFVLLLGWLHRRSWYRAVVAIPMSLLIAVVGCYWMLERLLWI